MFRILIFSANMSRHALHDRVFRYKYGIRMGKKHKQGRRYSISYSSLVKYLISKFAAGQWLLGLKFSWQMTLSDLKHFFKKLTVVSCLDILLCTFFKTASLESRIPLCQKVAWIEPRNVALRHWKSDALSIWLDLIQPHSSRSHPYSPKSHPLSAISHPFYFSIKYLITNNSSFNMLHPLHLE